MSWSNYPLGEVCKVQRGTTITQTQSRHGDIPVVAGGMTPTYFHDTPNRNGNVITISASGASAGYVNYWKTPIFASDCSTVVSERSDVDIRFVYYFLTSKQDYINSKLRSGAAQPHVYAKDIAKLVLPLPTLPEQRRIAAILDQADQLRVKRREALAELDRLTQSIFVEMFGDVVRNDKKWSSFSVGELTDCIVPGRDKPKSFSGNVPWVTTEDLVHLGFTSTSSKGLGLSPSEISEVGARVIPAGSVIISCVGNLGISTIASKDIVINQQLHSYQCHSKINNIYLMYCLALQSNYMYARASSTTLPYMNKAVCNSIPIAVPPIKLQEEFSKQVQKIKKHKEILESSHTDLNSLFTSLQHRAFRGEL